MLTNQSNRKSNPMKKSLTIAAIAALTLTATPAHADGSTFSQTDINLVGTPGDVVRVSEFDTSDLSGDCAAVLHVDNNESVRTGSHLTFTGASSFAATEVEAGDRSEWAFDLVPSDTLVVDATLGDGQPLGVGRFSAGFTVTLNCTPTTTTTIQETTTSSTTELPTTTSILPTTTSTSVPSVTTTTAEESTSTSSPTTSSVPETSTSSTPPDSTTSSTTPPTDAPTTSDATSTVPASTPSSQPPILVSEIPEECLQRNGIVLAEGDFVRLSNGDYLISTGTARKIVTFCGPIVAVAQPPVPTTTTPAPATGHTHPTTTVALEMPVTGLNANITWAALATLLSGIFLTLATRRRAL